jgi:AcrR family transcriptional regulator
MAVATRPYRGVSAEQRRAERRERLIEAGLEVIAARGWPAATVREVCAEARLTERYFYESFEDRGALLVAVFDHVAERAAQAVLDSVRDAPRDASVQARAAIGAFVDLVAEDPRKARVLFLEAAGSEALAQRRRQAINAFARLVRDEAAEFYKVPGPLLKDAELTAHALVGGLAQLLMAWLSGELKVSRKRLIDHCAELFVAAAGVRSGKSDSERKR